MGKEFTGYTEEATQYINTKGTLAIIPMLTLAKENRFNELFDMKASKVKIMLQEGAGDEAKRTSFNLTIDEFEYLYFGFTHARLNIPYNLIKPCQEKISTGDYKELYYTSAFSLEYDAQLNNPWKITIKNGYGQEKAKFDKYTMTKSFMVESSLFKLLNNTKNAIEMFKYTYCPDNIKKGYAKIAELQTGNIEPSEQRNVPSYKPEMNDAPAVASETTSNTQANAQKDAQPDIRVMNIQVISDAIAVNGANVCAVIINGAQYNMYMKAFTPELQQSLADQTLLSAKLCADNSGNLWYAGVAA